MNLKIRAAIACTLILFVSVSGFGQTDSSFSFGAADSPFGAPAARAETSARLAAWNPQEGTGLIAVRFVYPEGYHQIDDEEFFTLRPEPADGIIFGSTLKGEPVYKDGLAEYFDETTLVMEFRTAPDIAPTVIGINALFQICDDFGVCLFPDSEFHEIEFDPGSAPVDPDPVVLSVLEWSSGIGDTASAPVSEGPGAATSGASLLLYLLMALVGGVLLNVMPCVLPLLSVKALGLGKQAGQDRRAILRHSWLYVAGIEVSFWALAAIVVILQTSGRLLGWGFQFQSPGFVLILTAVIWIFALSMFDVFVIEAPRKGMEGASAAGARGGYAGRFLTGIFAVLVARPSTAPVLGAALGFAFSQPPLVIFAIFSVTGLGLGLPFLLLGIWPKIIGKLPKPGNWMNTFKEVMGFLLLGTAVYLFTTFAKLAPGALNGAVWWLLFLGFAAWLLGRARQPLAKRWFRYAGQIIALVTAVGTGLYLVDIPENTGGDPAPSAELSSDGSITFVEEDILGRLDAGEPVFLEFTAAWCTTCKVNQRVIRDREIQELMQDRGVVHIKGDLTAYDETLTRWLADFGRAGVPLYVLYRPGEEPHMFPELITVDNLRTELEKL